MQQCLQGASTKRAFKWIAHTRSGKLMAKVGYRSQPREKPRMASMGVFDTLEEALAAQDRGHVIIYGRCRMTSTPHRR